jgi:tRNA threonylcarbamoyladenosine biosynthesis protein TsaB
VNLARPLLLALDTAGSACSAAVLRGPEVLAAERCAMRYGHAEALVPMIERVAQAAGIPPGGIDIVAAATGPGGFTGIRAGLAAAHGIALGSAARLLGVTSFEAIAAAARTCGSGGGALLVALDSRRSDFYVQLFAADRVSPLSEPAAIPPDRLARHVAGVIDDEPLLIMGDAAEAARAALRGPHGVSPVPDAAAGALGVAAAALHRLRSAAKAEPMQPLYLRPPDVTLPKRRLVPLPAGAAVPLSRLHRACFPEDPWDAASFERILGFHGVFGFVAWFGDTPAGFAVARDLGGEAEILTIGVLPRMRRLGIGRALLADIIAQAGRQGVDSVVLEVAADNEPARRLYASQGFAQVGRRPRYYRRRDGLADALVLRFGRRAAPDGAAAGTASR